jgi:adenylate cyclase
VAYPTVTSARQTVRSRVRPAATLVVTRLRKPVVRTAQVTVLFADLRGYTGLAESLPAARVLPLLDEFFSVLAIATHAYGGKVFHMAGDGMMAGFGVDQDNAMSARAALACGHAMLNEFSAVALRWREQLSIEVGIGVGLHAGEVAVGTLGPARQRTTTLVGDTVNVAARLCSRARAGEVLFSCTVAAALESNPASPGVAGAIPFLQLPQFELRGRRGPIDIWCVPALERLAL